MNFKRSKIVAVFLISWCLQSKIIAHDTETANQKGQSVQDQNQYSLKQVAKLGAWGWLTYVSTAFVMRNCFTQKVKSSLSNNQIYALLPVLCASGGLFYYLILKNKPQATQKDKKCSSTPPPKAA